MEGERVALQGVDIPDSVKVKNRRDIAGLANFHAFVTYLSCNDRNLHLIHSYQEPKSSRESYPSASRREPQGGAGQATGQPFFVSGG